MCIAHAFPKHYPCLLANVRPEFARFAIVMKEESEKTVCMYVCVYTLYTESQPIDSAAVANLAPNEQTATTKLKYDRRRESFAGAQVNGVAHGLPPHFKCSLVKIVLYTYIFISISLRQDLT